MSEYMKLYETIDSLLPQGYNITWGDMDALSENACGIYLRSGNTGAQREISGNVYIDSCNLVLYIHSNISSHGIIEGLDYASKARRTLIQCINRETEDMNNYWNDEKIWDDLEIWYDTLPGERVHILRIEPIGNVNSIGKNEQGIPIFTVNFTIYYSYKEE